MCSDCIVSSRSLLATGIPCWSVIRKRNQERSVLGGNLFDFVFRGATLLSTESRLVSALFTTSSGSLAARFVHHGLVLLAVLLWVSASEAIKNDEFEICGAKQLCDHYPMTRGPNRDLSIVHAVEHNRTFVELTPQRDDMLFLWPTPTNDRRQEVLFDE